MARKPTPGARDCILDIAARLFYENGVHAVGLQQIIDEYGCGKNLLYREFGGKDELVVAWLDRCHDEWVAKSERALEPLAGDPAAQIVAIVRAAATDATETGFRGCALRNTHAEFPDPDHPAHQVAVEHLGEVRAQLRDLATRAGARDPHVLADRIMLIIDGLIANGAMLGDDGAATAAIAFAEDVVTAATRGVPAGSPRSAEPA